MPIGMLAKVDQVRSPAAKRSELAAQRARRKQEDEEARRPAPLPLPEWGGKIEEQLARRVLASQ